MNGPGLVCEAGGVRLAGFAEEAIAETKDEVAEFIIGLVEGCGDP